jgi:magnesium-transporting ATPase (P-type)
LMSTGDNIFTSLSIAREIEMFDYEKEILLIESEDGDSKLKITKLATDYNSNNEKKPASIRTRKDKRSKSMFDSSFLSERKLLEFQSKDEKNDEVFFYKLEDFKKGSKDSLTIDLNKIPSNADFDLDKSLFYVCISGSAFINLLDIYDKINKKEKIRNQFLTDLVTLVQDKGRIFYRMTPTNKFRLINFIKEDKDNIVAMCGDGANDCAAILASDLGISIKNNGNNLVASHFYFRNSSISCVELILRNGRACFENSFITLKIMVAYALIQICTSFITFTLDRNVNPDCLIFMDCFAVLFTTLLATITNASYDLNPSKLFYRQTQFIYFLKSVLGQCTIQIIMQAIYFYLFKIFRPELVYKSPYYFDNVSFILIIVFFFILNFPISGSYFQF